MKAIRKYFIKLRLNYWFKRCEEAEQRAAEASTQGGNLYWLHQASSARTKLRIAQAAWRAIL